MKKQTELVEIVALLESGDHENALEQLEQIDLMRSNPADWSKLETAIITIPESLVKSSASLCFAMLMLQNGKGDLEAARKWQSVLASLRHSAGEDEPGRGRLDFYYYAAGIGMPNTENAQILLSLAALQYELHGKSFLIPELDVTGHRPSILRGAKDLSDWGRNYRAVAGMLSPILENLLPDSGRGICETAIAELLYEKNQLSAASKELTALPEAKNVAVAFAGNAVLVRIALANPFAGSAEEALNRAEQLLTDAAADYLRPQLESLRIRCEIARGNPEKIALWVNSLDLEGLKNYCLRNMYNLITCARALLFLDRSREALNLLELLIEELRLDIRPLDLAECLIAQAIAYFSINDRNIAYEKLNEAFLLVQGYGYIRVFADFGEQVFQLIRYAKTEQALSIDVSKAYIEEVEAAAQLFSELYPSQITPSAAEDTKACDLTEQEIQVLRLIREEAANPRIAQELQITQKAVKLCIAELMSKLHVDHRDGLLSAALQHEALQHITEIDSQSNMDK